MGSLTKAVLCLALVFATGAATAAASTAPGILTQPEYQQLRSLFGRLDAVRGTSLKSFRTKASVCRHTQAVSALVSAEKTNCLDAVEIGLATSKVQAVVKRCDSKTSVSASLNCLIPSYRVFYRSLENEFLVLRRLGHIDKARDFTADCVTILGGASAGVRRVGLVAHDAGQVLVYLRSHNTTRLRTAEDRLFAAENSTTGTTTARGSLASCAQAL